MKPGDVLFWKGFSFDDGGVGNKLLLIVGVAPSKALLMLKTTSQFSKFRPDADGCHSNDSVHCFKTKPFGGFDKQTWIQFDPAIIYFPDECLKAGAHVVHTLKAADLAAIINCYRQSPDISLALAKFLR